MFSDVRQETFPGLSPETFLLRRIKAAGIKMQPADMYCCRITRFFSATAFIPLTKQPSGRPGLSEPEYNTIR